MEFVVARSPAGRVDSPPAPRPTPSRCGAAQRRGPDWKEGATPPRYAASVARDECQRVGLGWGRGRQARDVAPSESCVPRLSPAGLLVELRSPAARLSAATRGDHAALTWRR